jgi:hypothetical protein
VVKPKRVKFGPLFSPPAGTFLASQRCQEIDMPPYTLRAPVEPSPTPVHNPIDPPENPDVPVREPEPDDPNQI